MKCCADQAGAGRPHVDQPEAAEAADLHHVAAATVDAEDIRCCRASSKEKKKLTIKGCFMLCMFQQRLVLTAYSLFSRWNTTDFRQNRCTGLWVCILMVKCTYSESLWINVSAK